MNKVSIFTLSLSFFIIITDNFCMNENKTIETIKNDINRIYLNFEERENQGYKYPTSFTASPLYYAREISKGLCCFTTLLGFQYISHQTGENSKGILIAAGISTGGFFCLQAIFNKLWISGIKKEHEDYKKSERLGFLKKDLDKLNKDISRIVKNTNQEL